MSYYGATHNGRPYQTGVLQAGQFLKYDNLMCWIKPGANSHKVQVKTVTASMIINGHAMAMQTTAINAPTIFDTTITNSAWTDLMPVNVYGVTGSTQRILIRCDDPATKRVHGIYVITAHAGALTGVGAFDKFALTLERMA